MNYHTQINTSWLRRFSKNQPHLESMQHTDKTIIVKQSPRIVYETFKQEGIEMKLSRFRGESDWAEITPGELDSFNEDCVYEIELINLHDSNITFQKFNNLLEEWGVYDLM